MSQISEENLRCKCGAILPPTARKCSICGTDFIPQFSPTVVDEATSEEIEVDQDIPEPNPDAVPHYLKKLDTVFILIIIFLGIIVNFSVFKSNRQKILKKLINECILALKEVKSPYWRLRSEWPPHNAIKTIYIIKGVFYDLEQDFIQKSGIIVKKDSLYLPSNEFSEETFNKLRQEEPETTWLIINCYNSLFFIYLKISYWTPRQMSIPNFQWPIGFEGQKFLYWRPFLQLFLLILILGIFRFWLLHDYRTRQRKVYEKFQVKRTENIFKIKSRLENARNLAESGQIAKAIIAVNDVLKSMPKYRDALELKKLLQLSQDAGVGTLTISSGSIFRNITPSDSLTLLYLRIIGTPYAYEAPSGVERLCIGRQRRNPGDSKDKGNDVVIRVPGLDERSLRISRKHLIIQRIDTEYFVIDRSEGNTKLNGKTLQEKPVRVNSGDRLLIAGVLTLEILIRPRIRGSKVNNMLQVSSSNRHYNNLSIEATIGDMLTEIRDE